MSSDNQHLDLTRLHLGPLRRLLGSAEAVDEQGPFFDRVGDFMLFRDPPDHTRLRRLVSRSFTARRVEQLEPRIRTIVDELLDEAMRGDEIELMSEVAYPFPARVICELVGVPPADAHRITGPAPDLAGGLDPGPLLTREAAAAANAAAASIVDYLEDLIDERRRDPGDDLLSALLHDDEADLHRAELISIVLLLLVAGHETTANLLGNAVVALSRQPEAARELRAGGRLDATAVDELLRFDSPVQMTMRIATDPIETAVGTIDPGTVVILCTGAANRDETVFDQPDRLDWHRTHNPHLAFGGGIHHCLGAPLARTEARIGLQALLDRLPELTLAAAPIRRPSFTIRGLSSLHLATR